MSFGAETKTEQCEGRVIDLNSRIEAIDKRLEQIKSERRGLVTKDDAPSLKLKKALALEESECRSEQGTLAELLAEAEAEYDKAVAAEAEAKARAERLRNADHLEKLDADFVDACRMIDRGDAAQGFTRLKATWEARRLFVKSVCGRDVNPTYDSFRTRCEITMRWREKQNAPRNSPIETVRPRHRETMEQLALGGHDPGWLLSSQLLIRQWRGEVIEQIKPAINPKVAAQVAETPGTKAWDQQRQRQGMPLSVAAEDVVGGRAWREKQKAI
jgi:hypothetical protein